MSVLPLALRLGGFGQPPLSMPPGALAIWYTDQNVASPRPYIPNAVSTLTAQPNLFSGSRRLFSNASLWSEAGLTITDANLTAPDGSGDASTITGSGAWHLTPTPAGSFPLTAGSYLIASHLKWLGGGSASFQLGEFGTSQLGTKTATGSWSRFTEAFTIGSNGNYFPGILAAGGSSVADFGIIDFELYPGSVDLGPNPQAGHLYLCNADGSPGASISGDLVDFSSGKFGIAQFPSGVVLSSGITVIYVGKLVNAGSSGFEVILSNIPNFHSFAVGNQPAGNGGPGIIVNSAQLGAVQQTGSLIDYPGAGIAVNIQSYDGASIAKTWVNDVEFLSGAAGAVGALAISDLFAGIVFEPSIPSGYELFAAAVFPGEISDAFKKQAVAALVARCSVRGVATIQPTQKSGFFLGDSLTAGIAGTFANPGYAYLVPASANPPIRAGNYAVGGGVVADMAALLPGLYPNINQALKGGRNAFVHIWLGANDLRGAGSATTFLNNLTTNLCTPLYTNCPGVEIVLGTVLSQGNGSGSPAISETVRTAANGAIRSYVGTFCDAISDFASDATIGQAGAFTNTSVYSTDQVHLNSAGHVVAAPYAVAAINGV